MSTQAHILYILNYIQYIRAHTFGTTQHIRRPTQHTYVECTVHCTVCTYRMNKNIMCTIIYVRTCTIMASKSPLIQTSGEYSRMYQGLGGCDHEEPCTRYVLQLCKHVAPTWSQSTRNPPSEKGQRGGEHGTAPQHPSAQIFHQLHVWGLIGLSTAAVKWGVSFD